MALNSSILKSIEEVSSPEEFNRLLEAFQLSNADMELKEEAIHTLKAQKSVYHLTSIVTPKDVIDEILAGQADIDDIVN